MSPFEVRVAEDPTAWTQLAGDWHALRRRVGEALVQHHPAWLESELLPGIAQNRKGRVVSLYRSGELLGVMPVLEGRWRLSCRVGYLTAARFPVQLVHVCGGAPLAVPDPEIQGALLDALLRSAIPHDLVHFECLPVDSPLWHRLRSSSLRASHWLHAPWAATPRRVLQLPGSFEEYLRKFGSRTRQSLRHKQRKLAQGCGGTLRVECYRSVEDVDRLLPLLQTIAARSWQGRRVGQSYRGEGVRDQVKYWASVGWLRAYVLFGAEAPIAFVLGLQSDGVFQYEAPGYDRGWAAYSPGTVLLYRLLEDLFAHDPPRRLDFGDGDNPYKALFGTHEHQEVRVYLVRKSAYNGFATFTHRTTLAAGRWGLGLLDRLRLRERIRHVARGLPGGR